MNNLKQKLDKEQDLYKVLLGKMAIEWPGIAFKIIIGAFVAVVITWGVVAYVVTEQRRTTIMIMDYNTQQINRILLHNAKQIDRLLAAGISVETVTTEIKQEVDNNSIANMNGNNIN